MFKEEVLENQSFITALKIKKRKYELYEDLLELKKIVSFVGPRRVGKTFLMFQFLQELREKNKIKIEQMVFIDFSLHAGKELDYKQLLTNFKELYPDTTPFFVFDEIQDISNFKVFVLGLYQLGYQIFVSGSNSKLLSSELSTNFRGRVFEYQVLPLSFEEVLSFHDIPLQKTYTSDQKAEIKNIFHDILRFGSFPEIVLAKNNIFKIDNLKTYLDVMIYKDLLERYKIENEVSLKFLLKNLSIGYTKGINITKIYNALKSQNIKVGKSTLFDYYEYIKNIFYVFELENFYNQKAAKKSFLYNIGFNKLFSQSPNFGQAFENLVFFELYKNYKQIFFKKNGGEIDFFIPEIETNFQVCYELNDENFERETKVFQKTPKHEKNILLYFEKHLSFERKINATLVSFFEFVR